MVFFIFSLLFLFFFNFQCSLRREFCRRGNCNINYSENCNKCDRGQQLNVRGGGRRLQKFESQRGFGKKLSDNWWWDSIIPSSASDEVRPRIDTNRAERLRRKHCDWKIEVGTALLNDPMPSISLRKPRSARKTSTPETFRGSSRIFFFFL